MKDDEINLDESMQEELDKLRDKEDETEIEDEETDESGEERDEKGRFKKPEEETEAEQEDEETDELPEEEKTDEPGTDPGDSEDDPKLKRPPTTWTPEAKSLWDKVNPRIRQEILKREKEGMDGVNQMREKATYGERLQQIIHPYTPLIQSSGSTPEQTIQGLLNTAYRLRTSSPQEKAQLLIETAKRYGADMSVFGNQEAGQENQVINDLRQEIHGLKSQLDQFQQSSVQLEQTQARQQIETFANEIDEDGNLKYPYFDNVRNQMAIIIQAAHEEGKSKSLEETYNEATWANPDTRPLMMAAQTSEAELKRQAEAKERVKKAKKADKTNLKGKPGHESKQQKPTGSVDDTMRETMDNIKSRDS